MKTSFSLTSGVSRAMPFMFLALLSTSTTQVDAGFDLSDSARSSKTADESSSFHQILPLQNVKAIKSKDGMAPLVPTLNQNFIADTSARKMNPLSGSDVLFRHGSHVESTSMHQLVEQDSNGNLDSKGVTRRLKKNTEKQGKKVKNQQGKKKGKKKKGTPYPTPMPSAESFPPVSSRPSSISTKTPSSLPPTNKLRPVASTTPSATPTNTETTAPSMPFRSSKPTVTNSLPTSHPTSSPTLEPTMSQEKTRTPTQAPSKYPTAFPTTMSSAPSVEPTKSPLSPVLAPTKSPVSFPTASPVTSAPTKKPTEHPTPSPVTSSPTVEPTEPPVSYPTLSPTTATPTMGPTKFPTSSPTATSTTSPTKSPTKVPTLSPSAAPTHPPTYEPTESPTLTPTAAPTTTSPTKGPTPSPTLAPQTFEPSTSPTIAISKVMDALSSGIAGVEEFVSQEFDNGYRSEALSWLLDNPDVEEYLPDYVVQRYALSCIFYSLNGTGWSNNENWLSLTGNECDGWFGISCTPDGKVAELALSYNRLQGSLPPEIILLESITYLDIYDNAEIANEGDPGNRFLGQMESLEYLYYGNTGFKYAGIPTEIGLLTNLIEYDCEYTQYWGSFNSDMWLNLQNLNALYLGGLNYEESVPLSIASLPNLQYLYIEESAVTGDLSFLSLMTNLVELWLDYNDISGTIPTEIGDLVQLQSLSVPEMQLTGTIPTEIGELANLNEVWLFYNSLTGTVPSELSNLGNLERIELDSNQLSGSVPNEICTRDPFILTTFTVDCVVECACCTDCYD